MVNNPLLRSFIVVAILWYVIAALWGADMPLLGVPLSLGHSLLVVVAGGVAGAMVFLIAWFWGLGETMHRLLAHSTRGAMLSLGDFPPGPPPPERKRGDEFLSEDMSTWFGKYSQAHPKHGALLKAAAEVMLHKAIPASPVHGGHGGASLAKHSENVLRMALARAKGWQYEGHKNKSGKVVFPPMDHRYRFDPEDPVIPLCAYLHDIGKLACYQLQTDGTVEEIRPNHDEEGGKLLLSIPEYWDLPRPDRELVNISVSYYHHIPAMPLWCNDRIRAITEFLIMVDIETGKTEGEGNMEAAFRYMEAGEAAPYTAPAISPTLAAEMEAEIRRHDQLLNQDKPELSANQATIPSPAAPQAGNGAYYALLDLLAEPGRINGNDKNLRVGFKHGEWVYVSDAKLRSALANHLEDPSLSELPGRGQMHTFTLSLLEELQALGALMDSWGGMLFSPKRALFKMVVHGSGGKIVQEWPFTIIFKTSLIPHLASMPDCRYPPEIVGPGWGEVSALNKKGGGEQEGSPSLDEPVVDEVDLPVPNHADDMVTELRRVVDRLDPEVPFKILKENEDEWAYFPEGFITEKFALSPSDPAPEGAKWARGKEGLFLGIRTQLN